MAEITGKLHRHVMRDIRAMEPAWEKINQSKFGLVDYVVVKGEKRPMYELTKTECLYVSTKFNDEARAMLVFRWEKLERGKSAIMANSSYSVTDPIERAKAWIKEQEKAERCLALRGSKTSLNWLKSQRNSIALSYDTSGTKSAMGVRHDAKTLYTIIDYAEKPERKEKTRMPIKRK